MSNRLKNVLTGLAWFFALLSQPVLASIDAVPMVTIAESLNFTAQRKGRYAIIELNKPHRLLSTSRFNGGQKIGIRYVVNHQSMESKGDTLRFNKVVDMSSEQYHQEVAGDLGLSADDMVLMGTAASMNRMAHANLSYRDLRVDAFVTAGVKGNATRAGDPARWYQGDTGNQLAAYQGTINIILLINKPLTPAAQARAASILVEAKSSVLAQLAIPSKVSPHIATGTGTDQYVIATVLNDSVLAFESASSHVKLGELVGSTVREALLEALRWQNGLELSATGNVIQALGRFGLDETTFLSMLEKQLPAPAYQLLKDNKRSVLTEPRVVAAAYAYAAVLDRIQYGSIPAAMTTEVLRDQAASVAVALSMRPSQWAQYWLKINVDSENTLQAFSKAIALGWVEKWAADEKN